MQNIIIFIIIIIIRFLINVQIQGQHPHQWAPFQVAADLTPDLKESLSWGWIAEGFHFLQSLSVSWFHVILGLPGPCFRSTCMSKAVLTAPLERSICPNQWSLLSFRIRSRSSMPSQASSSLDLVVTMSCGLTLQICHFTADIGGLAYLCRCWRFGSTHSG